jgi:hypothetical protein
MDRPVCGSDAIRASRLLNDRTHVLAMTYFRPDAGLQKLAAIVNKQLPSGLMINLYRVEHEDGSSEIGVTYSFGALRTTEKIDGRQYLTEHDAPMFIEAAIKWGNTPRHAQLWTADPDEADRGHRSTV